jgi:hypothetical protein
VDVAELIDGILVKHRDHPEWGIGSIERMDRGQAVIRFYGRDEVIQRCAPNELLRHRYAPGDQIFALTD